MTNDTRINESNLRITAAFTYLDHARSGAVPVDIALGCARQLFEAAEELVWPTGDLARLAAIRQALLFIDLVEKPPARAA